MTPKCDKCDEKRNVMTVKLPCSCRKWITSFEVVKFSKGIKCVIYENGNITFKYRGCEPEFYFSTLEKAIENNKTKYNTRKIPLFSSKKDAEKFAQYLTKKRKG